ncbi:hypothetical protein HBB16_04145 [Pseudonocardia sp. MCCB 268]|nr:hypothetical protein [Pseudonocardia cytotoxica]
MLMQRFDAARTSGWIGEHRVTWLYVVPTMMWPDAAAPSPRILGVRRAVEPAHRAARRRPPPAGGQGASWTGSAWRPCSSCTRHRVGGTAIDGRDWSFRLFRRAGCPRRDAGPVTTTAASSARARSVRSGCVPPGRRPTTTRRGPPASGTAGSRSATWGTSTPTAGSTWPTAARHDPRRGRQRTWPRSRPLAARTRRCATPSSSGYPDDDYGRIVHAIVQPVAGPPGTACLSG